MNISYPFVCAGMAFVCETPDLAIAVINAGGVGCLAGSLLSPPTLSAHIRAVRSASIGPLHVNLLTPFPHEEQLKVCIAEQVDAVSFHWGHPKPETVAALKEAGIGVWMQVGSVEDAKKANGYGVDVIIVQGSEAGGHNYGLLPLATLLSSVRRALGDEALILAAGGVSDAHTTAAAFASGADGIWVGTRMIATVEANAHEEHKKRLITASGEETVLSSIFGPENPGFNPMRVIRNDLVNAWQGRESEIPHDRSAMPIIGQTVFAEQVIDVRAFDSFSPVPETTGDFTDMPMMAGQGVGLIESVQPAGDVIREMMAGATKILSELA